MRARYYDPELGRFLSEDPIKDGENWYAYCVNNPANTVDADGKFPFTDIMDFLEDHGFAFGASWHHLNKAITRGLLGAACGLGASVCLATFAVGAAFSVADCGITAPVAIAALLAGLALEGVMLICMYDTYEGVKDAINADDWSIKTVPLE